VVLAADRQAPRRYRTALHRDHQLDCGPVFDARITQTTRIFQFLRLENEVLLMDGNPCGKKKDWRLFVTEKKFLLRNSADNSIEINRTTIESSTIVKEIYKG
jgi:hypothetical protein